MESNRKAETGSSNAKAKRNPYAIAGFCLGIGSVFFYTIGILPILAVVVSAFGLAKNIDYGGKGKALGGIGLVLGILYFVMYLWVYGHLGHSIPPYRP